MFGDKAKTCDICGKEYSFYDLEKVSNTVMMSYEYPYNYSNKYSATVCSTCKKKIAQLQAKTWDIEAWNIYHEMQSSLLPENARDLIESYVPKDQTFEEVQQKHNAELMKQEYAKSSGDQYEYDVVTILNENHGRIDRTKMMEILSQHAQAGWKLHTIYSNELGKNAIMILGLGSNATACEDVLVFERVISKK